MNTGAVFLSYASEDAAAAQRLCTALRAAGVEVWFDQSALRGGDAWDAAIRKQIKTCSLFIPILSQNSQTRAEGYFRLEWKLAVDRSHLISSDRAYLLPVVIDATRETDDRAPERFRDVHWIRAPGGEPPPGFAEHVSQLLARSPSASPVAGNAGRTRLLDPTPTSDGSSPVSAKPGRRLKLAWALALVVAVGCGLAAMRYLSHSSPVVPYSLEDRRMTFAVLPFHAPSTDAHAALVAKASTDAVLANLESDTLFAQSAPRAQVDSVIQKHTAARDIAQALNVHFLIRGTLAPANSGYSLNLTAIDGATEQPLASEILPIPGDALVPRWEDDVDTAVWHLLMAGMHTEVQRVEDRPTESLDVRDLSFRALDYWRGHRGAEAKNGYVSASDLLRHALERAPDDALATYLTAEINLCDCVMAWSKNPDEQRAIGNAALEKFLRIDPTNQEMLLDKAGIFMLRGRDEDALEIASTLLLRHPDSSGALATKAMSLVRLGRPREALPIADELVQRYPDKWEELTALAADVHYAVADYAGAATLASNAVARMNETDLKSPVLGPVRLTLAASQARLGKTDRAKGVLDDFASTVPGVNSISSMRKWIFPNDPLAKFEPLYEGLKLAGVPE